MVKTAPTVVKAARAVQAEQRGKGSFVKAAIAMAVKMAPKVRAPKAAKTSRAVAFSGKETTVLYDFKSTHFKKHPLRACAFSSRE